ncbi:MAG: hypothetical protein K5790_05800 [Nitrosopumilus sp.]|uniref:hypothetical protein n=1 Tax=Nitrosopumilus sp. TaxID=2024843 RepID=UPI00247BA5A4|nr:hypothetical protein [Nitrosopumilus sp.]MCV0392794.1 hypothetical protein [Nitrosopumilus sp.]
MKKVIFVFILFAGMIPYASAAQLDAAIFFDDELVEPSFQFLRIIYIEYPNGGQISELLRGKTHAVSFVADSNTPGMDKLLHQLNQNLKEIPSNAIVTDAKINYQAKLQGNENSAVIEYKVELIPTITNHILKESFEKRTIDANWRGISIEEPMILETDYGSFDINNPKSAIDVMVPDVSKKLYDVSILEIPLIDASGIQKLQLSKWHSLFDNTAIISGAVEYKYTGKYVITHYTMGECSIGVGFCGDRLWNEEKNLDEQYKIKIVESRDDASISFEGYVDSNEIDGYDVFETSLKSLVNQKPDTDEFPATVMYGMAGFAVIGGIVMFLISNRKLKNDKNEGQTGIDPAYLRAFETSDSSGGYKTNRGESHLILSGKSKTAI